MADNQCGRTSRSSEKRCFSTKNQDAVLSKSPSKRLSAVSVVAASAVGFALAVGVVAPAADALAKETLASIVRGGRLYDNWHSETKSPAPKTPHPAYPADKAFATNPGANWRCKECHGWDYMGRDGAYARGEHFTGIKGIRGMAGADPEKTISVLKDETHQYDGLMSEQDFRDLANFVAKGQVEMDRYIDRASGMAKGGETRHEAYYTTICANCHGTDGLRIRTMPPLGAVAKTNPWEALHKILNGHPGENMPALRALDMSILIDVLAYVQTLPTEK